MNITEIEDRFTAMEQRIKTLEEELLETKELLAISLKRNTVLENALFAKNDDGDIITENDSPVISPNFTHFEESQEEETFIPETKLEKTALELIKYACSRPIVDGVRAITPLLLHQFREGILPKELRPNTVNPRQWKKELFDLLCNLFPEFKTEKKGNNRGVRLLIPRSFDVCKLRVS